MAFYTSGYSEVDDTFRTLTTLLNVSAPPKPSAVAQGQYAVEASSTVEEMIAQLALAENLPRASEVSLRTGTLPRNRRAGLVFVYGTAHGLEQRLSVTIFFIAFSDAEIDGSAFFPQWRCRLEGAACTSWEKKKDSCCLSQPECEWLRWKLYTEAEAVHNTTIMNSLLERVNVFSGSRDTSSRRRVYLRRPSMQPTASI